MVRIDHQRNSTPYINIKMLKCPNEPQRFFFNHRVAGLPRKKTNWAIDALLIFLKQYSTSSYLASVHMQLERPVQLRRGQNRRRLKESFYSLKSRLAYGSPVKLHLGLQEIRQRRNNRCITRTETMVKPHHAQDTHHVLFTRGRWLPVNGQSLCPNRTHLSFSPQ